MNNAPRGKMIMMKTQCDAQEVDEIERKGKNERTRRLLCWVFAFDINYNCSPVVARIRE